MKKKIILVSSKLFDKENIFSRVDIFATWTVLEFNSKVSILFLILVGVYNYIKLWDWDIENQNGIKAQSYSKAFSRIRIQIELCGSCFSITWFRLKLEIFFKIFLTISYTQVWMIFFKSVYKDYIILSTVKYTTVFLNSLR